MRSAVLALLPLLSGLCWAVGAAGVASFSAPHRIARRNHIRLLQETARALTDAGQAYQYRVELVEQPTDHFSYRVDPPAAPAKATFQQRLLVNDTWWDAKSGPIFLYTGNEGDIETFAQNTGLMWDLAPHFKALVAFAEHRYYGKSNPVPMPDSLHGKHPELMQYLTTEQALADFEADVRYLQKKYDCADCPIIAFGGSYGGMLAAYFRIRYPWAVAGAVSASAPVLYFSGDADWQRFFKIVTEDFADCAAPISRSWAEGEAMAQTPEGRAQIQKSLSLCSAPTTPADWLDIREWIAGSYVTMAMADYPSPANFLAPMPAWPVRQACRAFAGRTNSTGADLLSAVGGALQVLYNSTGTTTCLDWTGSDTPDLQADAWDYQTCTEYEEELYMLGGSDDMFWREEYNSTEWHQACKARFGVKPWARWAQHAMGGAHIEAASNIVFSNGDLDPWAGGGFTKNVNSEVQAVWIPEGAHHLDLRAQGTDDPPSVVDARNVEAELIERWIREWHVDRSQEGPPAASAQAFFVGALVGLGTGAIVVTVLAAILGARRLDKLANTYEALARGPEV